MHPAIQSRLARRCAWGVVCAVLLAGAGRAAGGDIALGFDWQNLEFRTYAPNSVREIADCKVGKVFLDHRKMGFFRVRLLPVLVVQGVRLEFGSPNPTNEWADSFQSDWLPEVKHGAVEWRDISIASQTPGAPRLHAGAAQLATGAPKICEFRDVTLAASGVTWRMARAELRSEDGRPRVVWEEGAVVRRLDLFSGEISSNSRSDKGTK